MTIIFHITNAVDCFLVAWRTSAGGDGRPCIKLNQCNGIGLRLADARTTHRDAGSEHTPETPTLCLTLPAAVMRAIPHAARWQSRPSPAPPSAPRSAPMTPAAPGAEPRTTRTTPMLTITAAPGDPAHTGPTTAPPAHGPAPAAARPNSGPPGAQPQ